MEMRPNANAIVTNKEGKFLLVRLKKGPFTGGLCIPGGGVEPGELSHETARREVLEETGIDVKSPFIPFGFCELKHDKAKKQKIVMLLHASAEGIPRETDEGIAKWYSYEEAEKELIPFAKEAIKIWRGGKVYFKLVNEEVGARY